MSASSKEGHMVSHWNWTSENLRVFALGLRNLTHCPARMFYFFPSESVAKYQQRHLDLAQ